MSLPVARPGGIPGIDVRGGIFIGGRPGTEMFVIGGMGKLGRPPEDGTPETDTAPIRTTSPYKGGVHISHNEPFFLPVTFQSCLIATPRIRYPSLMVSNNI